MKRNKKVGIQFCGEANDMTYEDMEIIMSAWHKNFRAKIAEKYTPPECVYNADQTGIYYNKLPNCVYGDEANKKDCAGVKQMKDKTLIALMVGTSAIGEKVPPDVVGEPKNPGCFKLMYGASPPHPYQKPSKCLV